ncbi:hypothetical protein H072_6264 [Dactylellina haptotyla CBS 200.50]|uniref:Uncharacterized protein n=1 Tax=Dactylellina haptotyla (strain CBS 200.50) TaxID=1284197 RepID=S8AAB0_DACHA|nr:hypothetical protein H072_6264 [Dactylellina haptotyla CBS 200.50]
MPTEAELEKWVEETVRIDRPGKGGREVALEAPAPGTARLYFLPLRNGIFVQVHHALIDGVGSMMILNYFLKALRDAKNPQKFGDGPVRLAPSPTRVRNAEIPSQDAMNKGNKLLINMVTFSESDSWTIIKACKAQCLTPTHAVTAAAAQALLEHTGVESGNFTSFFNVNMRPLLPEPYNTYAPATFFTPGFSVIPASTSTDFLDLAERVKHEYNGIGYHVAQSAGWPSRETGRSQPHKSNTESPPPPTASTAGCTSVAKRNTSGAVLAKYDAELKYFYFARRYTRDQVRNAMKAIFKLDAKASEYTYHLNKPEFKKYVKNEEWQAIAPYYHACEELGRQLVIKINGSYVIEPSVVKKEIGRNILLSQKPRIMQQKDTIIQNSTQSLELGRVQACISSNNNNAITRQAIPISILANLPSAQSSELWVDACQDIVPNLGESFAEGHATGIKRLLFLLSNNLFRNAQIDDLLDEIGSSTQSAGVQSISSEPGLSQFLQALLSLKTVAVEHALENILPLLILRGEVDLISHLFKIHGAIPVKWYIAFLEISLEQSHGYFFRTNSDRRVLFYKYRSNKRIIGQFLAKGIEIHQPFAVTCTETAVLLECAIRERLVKLDTLLIGLPPDLKWPEVETCYVKVYGGPVLSYNNCFSLLELLEFGFRKSLHTIAMEAIFRNDFGKAFILLSYSKLNLTKEELELLEYHSSSTGGTETVSVWDIVGVDGFKQLIRHIEQETGNLMENSTEFRGSPIYGWIQELLLVSFALGSSDLRYFLLGLLQAEKDPTGKLVDICVLEATLLLINRSRLPLKFYNHITTTGLWGNSSLSDIVIEWVVKLATTLYPSGDGKSAAPVLSKLLHCSIHARNTPLFEVSIQMGADVNAPDSTGKSPLVNIIFQWIPKDALDRTGCFESMERLLQQLFLAGAQYTQIDLMILLKRNILISGQQGAPVIKINNTATFRFKYPERHVSISRNIKMDDTRASQRARDREGLLNYLPELLAEMLMWSFGDCRTALYYAMEQGSLDIATYLVECGADIHASIYGNPWDNCESRSVLEKAVELGRLDFVALFLSVDISARDVALKAAIRCGASKMADWIQKEWGGKIMGTWSAMKEISDIPLEKKRKSVTHAGSRRSLLPMGTE